MRILLAILLLCAQAAAAKDFYVSVKGNDKNPGTKVQPFATLEKAKLEARKYADSVKVYLMSEIYYLKQALVFTEEDSREGKGPLIFTGIQYLYPEIKGSRRLKLQFRPFRDGILQATLPVDLPTFDQLFMDGELQVLARYPNYRQEDMPLHGTAANALSAERIRGWKDPVGGYIHALHTSEWGGMHYLITGKATDSTLTMEGGWQNNRPSAMHKNYRYVENIFEELDTTGEWYADHKRHLLFYKPAKWIKSIKKVEIEVPVLENLITIRGKPGQPVKSIQFIGLRFQHTLRTFMKNREPLLRSDWTIDRSGAILFDRTAQCMIYNCWFTNLGGNGLFFSNYNQWANVTTCTIADIGGSAVCFVGNPAAVRSPAFRYEQFVPYDQMDKTPGPIGDDFPYHCSVIDNHIHDIGLVEKHVAGIQISMAQEINIRNNTIVNTPRAGINIGDGTWGGHTIAYNDVYNTVQETGDHGAFNSWGRDRFWHPKRAVMDSLMTEHPDLWMLDAVLPTKIFGNRFRCDNGWDIDLDDGSSNYYIYNNVCLNGGLKLREGFHRVVKNNIILNNSFHPHVWFRNSRDTFMHNIVMGPYLPIGIKDWGKGIDSNFLPDQAAWQKSQQWGVDQHGAFGDPLFEDVTKGDYRVKATSGANTIGFRNFYMTFGVMSTGSKANVGGQHPVVLPVLYTKSGDSNQVQPFLGMKVKNLNTLAERSATGMDKETGVLILEVPSTSPWQAIVQPNDVILELAGTPVNNIQDLLNARMKVQWHASAQLIIFRDQKRQEVKAPLK
jgi:hypothetical protein